MVSECLLGFGLLLEERHHFVEGIFVECHRTMLATFHGDELFQPSVFLQHLRLKLAFPVSRHRYRYISEAGPQCFMTVTVAAVICVLVLVVILAVAQFIIQLCFYPSYLSSMQHS